MIMGTEHARRTSLYIQYPKLTSKVDNIYYGTLQDTVRITHSSSNHHLPTVSPLHDGVDFVNWSNRYDSPVTVYYV